MQWIVQDADEIVRVLSMDWGGIRNPSVARFRDVILKFRPFALACDDARWYVALNRRNEEYEGTVYLGEPTRPADLEKCLATHGLAGHELMREFYSHFAELRTVPLQAGNFERPKELRTEECE